MDIRSAIKGYLDQAGKDVPLLKDNLPGVDWLPSFIDRHKAVLSERVSNIIKHARASISAETLKEFHDGITIELKDAPPSKIL